MNAVKRLRAQEKAQSRRAFVARGSHVTRCHDCLLAAMYCVCDQAPSLYDGVAACLLYYKGEVFKPSNTGRLIADVLADTHAMLWQRQQPPEAFLTLVNDPRYLPVVVFPAEYIDDPARATTVDDVASTQRIPLLIFLDGTWREARKMFRSHWLSGFPVLSVSPQRLSEYQLREAACEHQLGTAEVAIPLLEGLGYAAPAAALEQHFTRVREGYLRSKTQGARQSSLDGDS